MTVLKTDLKLWRSSVETLSDCSRFVLWDCSRLCFWPDAMSNFVDVPMSAEKTFMFQPVFVSTPTPSLVLLSFSFLIASEISS